MCQKAVTDLATKSAVEQNAGNASISVIPSLLDLLMRVPVPLQFRRRAPHGRRLQGRDGISNQVVGRHLARGFASVAGLRSSASGKGLQIR